MSDTTREFIPGKGAFKRERSLSVMFGFEHRKSENPVIRRKRQMMRESARHCRPALVIIE